MLGPPADAPHHTAALVTAGIRKQIATCRGRGLADLRDRTLQLLGYARVLRRADCFRPQRRGWACRCQAYDDCDRDRGPAAFWRRWTG
jgi:hypothetical protein